MERVTIFLRTALFTLGGDQGHVPHGAMVVEARVVSTDGPGLTVRTTRFLDERGRTLGEQQVTLQLPWSKIDHVHVRD